MDEKSEVTIVMAIVGNVESILTSSRVPDCDETKLSSILPDFRLGNYWMNSKMCFLICHVALIW